MSNRPILKLNSSTKNESLETTSKATEAIKTKSEIELEVKTKTKMKAKIEKENIDNKIDNEKDTGNENASSKQVVSDSTTNMNTNLNTDIKSKSKRKSFNNISEEVYADILEFLQTHYPHAFTQNTPVPLAIGMHDQLFTQNLLYSKTLIRKFLNKYTSSKKYRQQLILGNNRHNLDGSIASTIKKQEINYLNNKRHNEKRTAHDAFIKKVMENPSTARELLDEFLPDHYKEIIDLSTLKVEKESFVDESLKKRLSDIVYSVKILDSANSTVTDTAEGDEFSNSNSGNSSNNSSINNRQKESVSNHSEAFVYFLLEHQVSSDHWIALRLWQYSLLLLEKHAKKKDKLPLILPLVIYNGTRKYSAPKNLWELFSHPEIAKKAMAEDYNLINLHAMQDNEIDYQKHLSFMLYTMKHIHERDTLKMLEQAMKQCKHAIIIDKTQDYLHTKLILWYADSKVPEEKKQLLEQIVVDNLPQKDSGNVMRTIADSYREEGKIEGISIGKAEGISIGEASGVKKIAINMLKQKTDPKFVASVTGISIEEIIKLQVESVI